MVPEKATEAPTIRATVIIICFFTLSMGIPKCWASFSPNIIAFRAFPLFNKKKKAITVKMPRIKFLVQVAPPKLPNVQKDKSRSCSSIDKKIKKHKKQKPHPTATE